MGFQAGSSCQCEHQKHVHSNIVSNKIESKGDQTGYCRFQEMQDQDVEKLRSSNTAGEKTHLSKMHTGRTQTPALEQQGLENIQDVQRYVQKFQKTDEDPWQIMRQPMHQ